MPRSKSMDLPNAQISDEAAEWFVELNAGEPNEETRREFDAWLRRSPEHVSAYLDMFTLWDDAAHIEVGADVTADSLIALCRAEGNVVSLSTAVVGTRKATDVPQQRSTRDTYRLYRLTASAVFVCLLVGVFVWLRAASSVFETDIGEQRIIALDDGSSIELNARSRVRVRFSETERGIDLLEGQALFRVAKDPQRPFVVHSGDTRVRAVGTHFDVYRKKQGTVVTVLEGRVAVLSHADAATSTDPAAVPPGAGLFLSAGEQATVTPKSTPHAEPVNVAAATAWRQRRMVFNDTPLTEVADEFNRYNERQLIVRDEQLSSIRVNGVFSSTDPASLLRFLRAQPDLSISIEETSAEIRILSR